MYEKKLNCYLVYYNTYNIYIIHFYTMHKQTLPTLFSIYNRIYRLSNLN